MEPPEYSDDVPMENVQYQWAGEPQDLDMAIDPRLYGETFVPSSQYAAGNGVNRQPPSQEQFDVSEPSTTSENEGIWSEEEAK